MESQANRFSASDSVDLIFTRSYHSTLLITSPTPSLVKTSLYKMAVDHSYFDQTDTDSSSNLVVSRIPQSIHRALF